MEIHLKITGSLFVVLSFIHIIFPSYFSWKKELCTLSIMNRQMMYVHSFFIAFTVMLMGILCITSAQELIETQLGRKIVFGLFIFWVVRLVFQIFVYSPELWRSKKFETLMHITFTIFWLYVSTVFLFAFLGRQSFW
jgi:hypothetical protein